MTASQIQNLLVLCMIFGYAGMEYVSRRYKTTVNATSNDTKLELFMFLSLLAITQPLAILVTAKFGRLACARLPRRPCPSGQRGRWSAFCWWATI